MILDMLPVDTELLSAQDFLNLVKRDRSLVKESRLVPGKLGDKEFGKFEVIYSRPIYKTKLFGQIKK